MFSGVKLMKAARSRAAIVRRTPSSRRLNSASLKGSASTSGPVPWSIRTRTLRIGSSGLVGPHAAVWVPPQHIADGRPDSWNRDLGGAYLEEERLLAAEPEQQVDEADLETVPLLERAPRDLTFLRAERSGRRVDVRAQGTASRRAGRNPDALVAPEPLGLSRPRAGAEIHRAAGDREPHGRRDGPAGPAERCQERVPMVVKRRRERRPGCHRLTTRSLTRPRPTPFLPRRSRGIVR